MKGFVFARELALGDLPQGLHHESTGAAGRVNHLVRRGDFHRHDCRAHHAQGREILAFTALERRGSENLERLGEEVNVIPENAERAQLGHHGENRVIAQEQVFPVRGVENPRALLVVILLVAFPNPVRGECHLGHCIAVDSEVHRIAAIG